MTHPLDEFMQTRTNTKGVVCVVCGGTPGAIVTLEIGKADENGRRMLGPKSSRSKRFTMCADHAMAMFDRTTAEGL
jgi:hypothetical protein